MEKITLKLIPWIMRLFLITRCIPNNFIISKNKQCSDCVLNSIFINLISKNSQFSFIQIGAYHGNKRDIVHKLLYTNTALGLLVEPQKEIFELLKKNMSGKNFILKNVAIDTRDSSREFYTYKFDSKSKFFEWTQMLGSFNKQHLLYHHKGVKRSFMKENLPIPKDLEQFIISTEVRCVTLDTLCRDCNITHLDFLQVDAEGHDFDVLKSFSFNFKPKIIHYEHFHLFEKQTECEDFLRAKGYFVCRYSQMDTVAISSDYKLL